MNMKTAAFILIIFFIGVFLSCSHHTANSKSAAIVPFTDSNWVFIPAIVRPQVGNSTPVNGNYTVSLNSHKLNVYLPYFGRAYDGSDVFSGKNPLDFISTDFTINQLLKKNGQEFIIRPNDQPGVQSMDFTFYTGGNANLYINMFTRSGIGFTGNARRGK